MTVTHIKLTKNSQHTWLPLERTLTDFTVLEESMGVGWKLAVAACKSVWRVGESRVVDGGLLAVVCRAGCMQPVLTAGFSALLMLALGLLRWRHFSGKTQPCPHSQAFTIVKVSQLF